MRGCAQIHANYVQAFVRMQTQFGNGNAQGGGGNIYSGANRLIIPDYRGDNSARPRAPVPLTNQQHEGLTKRPSTWPALLEWVVPCVHTATAQGTGSSEVLGLAPLCMRPLHDHMGCVAWAAAIVWNQGSVRQINSNTFNVTVSPYIAVPFPGDFFTVRRPSAKPVGYHTPMLQALTPACSACASGQPH